MPMYNEYAGGTVVNYLTAKSVVMVLMPIRAYPVSEMANCTGKVWLLKWKKEFETFYMYFEYFLVNRAMRNTPHVSLLSLTSRIPFPAESMNDVKGERERGKGCTYSEMKRAARRSEEYVLLSRKGPSKDLKDP
ncbi:hypothetical protein ACTXT7_001443 [Hymenolepis weldensis]